MHGYRDDQIEAGYSGFYGREDSFADNLGAGARRNARSQVGEDAKYFLACYLQRSGAKDGYAGAPSNLMDQTKFALPGLHCAMGELRRKAAKIPGQHVEKDWTPLSLDMHAKPVKPWRKLEIEPSILAWDRNGDSSEATSFRDKADIPVSQTALW